MEGPERTWFGLQGGGSTKDQGPGFWSDTMDDKFSHWNWTKFVGLGKAHLVSFMMYPHALTHRSAHQEEVLECSCPIQDSR